MRSSERSQVVIAKEMVRPLIIVASALAISGAMIAVYCWLRPLFDWVFKERDPLAYPQVGEVDGDYSYREHYNGVDILSVAVEAYMTANHRLPETIADMEQYFPDDHGHYSPSGKRCGIYIKGHANWPSVQHYQSKSDLESHIPHLDDGSMVYTIIEKPRTYAVICGFSHDKPHVYYPHNGFDTDELFQRRRDAALTKNGSSVW